MSQVLREHAIGMLTAGMSTRAVGREFNVHFSTISRLQMCFREFGSTSNRPQNRRPRVTTPAQDLHIFTSKIVWDQSTGQLLQQSVCITKEFLHKLSETVSGKLICMLVVHIGVSTWLQFVIVTDLSGQMLTFDGVWHFWEVFSSRMSPSFHCTGQMADSVYGVVWVSGLLMSTLWTMVAVGLWYGQVMLWTTNKGAFYWWRFECRDTVTRSWGPLLCHSSTTITSCCKDLCTIPGSWKHPSSCMASILTGRVTHWVCLGSAYTTVCSSSCQYPATSHSHWRGVDQHSKGHNQQPNQLYAREMCGAALGKWWSHQILTGFRTPPIQ